MVNTASAIVVKTRLFGAYVLQVWRRLKMLERWACMQLTFAGSAERGPHANVTALLRHAFVSSFCTASGMRSVGLLIFRNFVTCVVRSFTSFSAMSRPSL